MHRRLEVLAGDARHLGREHGLHELLAPVAAGGGELLEPAVAYPLDHPVRVEQQPVQIHGGQPTWLERAPRALSLSKGREPGATTPSPEPVEGPIPAV